MTIQLRRTLMIFFRFGFSIVCPLGATIMRLYWKRIAEKRDEERMYMYHLDRDFSPNFGYQWYTVFETGRMKHARTRAEYARYKYDLYTSMIYAVWMWKKWELCYDYIVGEEFLRLPIDKPKILYQ